MNPLSIRLTPHTSYTKTGNFFSRFLLLQKNLKHYDTIVLVTEDTYAMKKYQKLCEYFKVPFFFIQKNYELTHLQNRTPGIYCIESSCLEDTIFPVEKVLHIELGAGNGIYKDIEELNNIGYRFQEYGKKGSYKRQGDILHIYDFSGFYHYTLSYWGEDIESIVRETIYGEEVLLKEEKKELTLSSNNSLFGDDSIITLEEVLREVNTLCVFDMIEFCKSYKNIVQKFMNPVSFDIIGDKKRGLQNLEIESLKIETLDIFQKTLLDTSKETYIYTKNIKLIEDFLKYNEIHHIHVKEVHTHILGSFVQNSSHSSKKGLQIICDNVIAKVFIKKRVSKKLSEEIDLLLKIKKGDYVIHIDHGVGVFHEIVKKKLGEVEKEYVELHYKENDKLFIPITEVSRISKYIGKENPSLTPLSGKAWEKKMAKIREDIREIAEELLSTFAERKLREGSAFVQNIEKLTLFQESFPYSYTHCQETAIEEILGDMEKKTTMDRLLVGDVGFGKTEIAFNAIYNAITNKKQVGLIVPLVVLAYEHYEKAIERFTDMGVRIAVLTRMESQKNVTQILKKLKEGSIDLVIGTHRLLGKNIVFRDLGLIVIDEEHKFGVTDKEKIKVIKSSIDVLSMSATPIPRSLNLALSGIRDISIIKTPPAGRQNIETYISPYEEKVILDAGKKEFSRGGQVFFVHNRVMNIEVYKKNLEKLFPTKKIIITHGQLPGDELEKRILAFKHKKYDILLSTTVIENGIDFSNVNTIFINECQSFGISQLHQLRGRVGRSDKKGYCYLLYKKEYLSNESAKRLQTVVNYSYLGAGFELAMKDLEIRGSGDILGIRQSGQVQEIGINLFLKMLEEKIQELKETSGKAKKIKGDTTIDLQISASISDDFFQSESDKIHFYREVESISSMEELNNIISDFMKVNEDIPEPTLNFFEILRLRIMSQGFSIRSIKRLGINYQIDFQDGIELERLKDFLRLDKQVKMEVVTIGRLRAPTKLFENDRIFLQYLLDMLENKISNPRVKLKKKKHIKNTL